eukprot:1264779-Pleurochrysis_carterae.AAC.1
MRLVAFRFAPSTRQRYARQRYAHSRGRVHLATRSIQRYVRCGALGHQGRRRPRRGAVLRASA